LRLLSVTDRPRNRTTDREANRHAETTPCCILRWQEVLKATGPGETLRSKSNTVSEDTGHTFPRAGDAKTSKHVQIQPCRAIPAFHGCWRNCTAGRPSWTGQMHKRGRIPAKANSSGFNSADRNRPGHLFREISAGRRESTQVASDDVGPTGNSKSRRHTGTGRIPRLSCVSALAGAAD
jgi:hypothetical protein